ncbi:MAG: hypothetical protein F6K48_04255 [Okeania sp. SIO3H1]|nr:hypothetical protein [Okeania sp. SIO3H1]
MVEGRQEAGGRRFSPIFTLILYTNGATGHDISHYPFLIAEITVKTTVNLDFSIIFLVFFRWLPLTKSELRTQNSEVNPPLAPPLPRRGSRRFELRSKNIAP